MVKENQNNHANYTSLKCKDSLLCVVGRGLAGQLIHSMFHKSSHWRESVETLRNKQTMLIEIATLSTACLSVAPWQQPSGRGGKGVKPCLP